MDPLIPPSTPHQFSIRLIPRYRLRTLLIFVTILCAGLAFFAVPGYRQKKALAALRKSLQVKVTYDYTAESRGPRAPDWLVRLAGVDYFADVVELEVDDAPPASPSGNLWAYAPGLRKANAFNEAIHPIGSLSRLRRLTIKSPDLTDNGVRHLRNLGQLESLNLVGKKVTGPGLEALSNLHRLSIEAIVPEKCITHLRELKHLESLEIVGWQSEGDGLKHLSEVPSLRDLKLQSVDDGDLRHLARLTKLESLSLTRPFISGNGLRHVARMSGLKHLEIKTARQCGTGIPNLADLRQLESLSPHLCRSFLRGFECDLQDEQLKAIELGGIAHCGRRHAQNFTAH